MKVERTTEMTAKGLAGKKRLTKAEKDFLLSEAAKHGISFTERIDCSDCWKDLALQIYRAEKALSDEAELFIEMSKVKYRLKDGVNVRIVGTGELINEAVMTDEYAENLISRGLSKYFEIIE